MWGFRFCTPRNVVAAAAASVFSCCFAFGEKTCRLHLAPFVEDGCSTQPFKRNSTIIYFLDNETTGERMLIQQAVCCGISTDRNAEESSPAAPNYSVDLKPSGQSRLREPSLVAVFPPLITVCMLGVPPFGFCADATLSALRKRSRAKSRPRDALPYFNCSCVCATDTAH